MQWHSSTVTTVMAGRRRRRRAELETAGRRGGCLSEPLNGGDSESRVGLVTCALSHRGTAVPGPGSDSNLKSSCLPGASAASEWPAGGPRAWQWQDRRDHRRWQAGLTVTVSDGRGPAGPGN